MNIIGHTSHLIKSADALNQFLTFSSVDIVEMDFRLTKDGKLVWTHNPLFDNRLVEKSNYNEVSKLMTLEEILELLKGDVALLLHLKGIREIKKENFDKILKALEILKDYPLFTEIQSFNPEFVKLLLNYKDDLNFMDIGLIINLFTTFKYRNGNIEGLEKIDFISLSSELWEMPKVGEDYKQYRMLFPNAREYAWTWEALYSESNKRIMNYMEKGADGIISRNAPLVRSLIIK